MTSPFEGSVEPKRKFHVCNGKLLLIALAIGLLCAACDETSNIDEEEQVIGFTSKALVVEGNNGSPASAFPLGLCEGDCDSDSDCEGGLTCYQRDANESVPGCSGGSGDNSNTDYYILNTGGTDGPDGSERNTLLAWHNDQWKYVYCTGSQVKVSASSSQRQHWSKNGTVRKIYNETVQKWLYCPELAEGYAPAECECRSSESEEYHEKLSATTGAAPASITLNNEIYIAPNNNMNACLKVIRGDQVHAPCAVQPWRNQRCRDQRGDNFSITENGLDCGLFKLNN